MSNATLTVGGKIFSGWQSVRIERGIEQIAGTFDLTVTDRWNTEQGQHAVDLQPGQACTVQINGVVVITGYIDTVTRRYDKTAHEISVSGRDKTGDLVDCSAIYKSGQWQNAKLEQIANDLCKPFGIAVKSVGDTGEAFPAFSIQEGETVFETLERAAKMKALLLVSDGSGGLVITRAGTAKAPAGLKEGENILTADGEFNVKDRFSDYIVKGQAQGSDQSTPETAAHPNGSSKDAGISRYRPLIITAEDQGGNATFKQRAEWERNVRAGRGTRATITVQGWEVNGQLWAPNTITRLSSPLLAADLDVLIISVGYSLDDAGTLATLQLAQPQAFDTIEGVKQSRMEKKVRMKKKETDATGITPNPEWEWNL